MKNERLAFLARKNKGLKLLPEFLLSLANVLNYNIQESDVLSLEETDRITEIFYNRFSTDSKIINETISEHNNEQIALVTAILMAQVGNEPGYLIMSQSEYCGAIRISQPQLIIQKFISIIRLDQDSLRFLSLDERKGIYIDYFEDNQSEKAVFRYDVSAWGWPSE